jgi:hypothetical protein
MSSTIRKQQIDEIKNYNQNINRQALAKSYNQVALWELERPESTPRGLEFSTKNEISINNIQILLQERLSVLNKVVSGGQISEKEVRILEKLSDMTDAYNKLIQPILTSRFDPSFRVQARNVLLKIKEPVEGILIGFKEIFRDIEDFGVGNVKGFVEAFTLYDYIHYQIDKEDYKLISIENLQSRIPQILSKLPRDVQELYIGVSERYEPQRAVILKSMPRKEESPEEIAEREAIKRQKARDKELLRESDEAFQAKRTRDLTGIEDFGKFIGSTRKELGDFYVDTYVEKMTPSQLGMLRNIKEQNREPKKTKLMKEYIDGIFQTGIYREGAEADPAIRRLMTAPKVKRSFLSETYREV